MSTFFQSLNDATTASFRQMTAAEQAQWQAAEAYRRQAQELRRPQQSPVWYQETTQFVPAPQPTPVPYRYEEVQTGPVMNAGVITTRDASPESAKLRAEAQAKEEAEWAKHQERINKAMFAKQS